MIDDVFCKIIHGEIPSEFVYRDKDIAVFKDLHPQAPVHLLIVPVEHLESIGDADDDNHAAILAKMLRIAHRVAREQGLKKGYRLILNEGEHGGKLVPHLHMHLLGGRVLGPKIVSSE